MLVRSLTQCFVLTGDKIRPKSFMMRFTFFDILNDPHSSYKKIFINIEMNRECRIEERINENDVTSRSSHPITIENARDLTY